MNRQEKVARRNGEGNVDLAFQDDCPLLLISKESLNELNTRTAYEVEMERFR